MSARRSPGHSLAPLSLKRKGALKFWRAEWDSVLKMKRSRVQSWWESCAAWVSNAARSWAGRAACGTGQSSLGWGGSFSQGAFCGFPSLAGVYVVICLFHLVCSALSSGMLNTVALVFFLLVCICFSGSIWFFWFKITVVVFWWLFFPFNPGVFHNMSGVSFPLMHLGLQLQNFSECLCSINMFIKEHG